MKQLAKLTVFTFIIISLTLSASSVFARRSMPRHTFRGRDYYWGVGLHNMYVDLTPDEKDADDYNFTGVRFTGGVVINKVFSVETHGAFMGGDEHGAIDGDGNIGTIDGELDYHYSVLARANAVQNDRSYLYLVLGYHATDVTWDPGSNLNLSQKTDSFSGLAYGVGANHSITPTTKLNFDIINYGTNESSDMWKDNLDLYGITLGVTQLF